MRKLAVAILGAGVLVGACVSATGAAAPVWTTRPDAVQAGDCDADGDSGLAANASHDEFLECSKAPPEPGKILPPSEKAKAHESLKNLVNTNPPGCPGVIIARDLSRPLVTPCDIKAYWITRLSQMVNDPPDAAVYQVALPVVPRVSSGWAPRQSQTAALAYTRAFAQLAAVTGALVTSLNRLSSTPATPESLKALPPQYSRRTQVAAARLYCGLLAAWSDRLLVARTNAVRLLRGMAWLPSGIPSGPLWAVYHQMNVYELAQLVSDLGSPITKAVVGYAFHHGGPDSTRLFDATYKAQLGLVRDAESIYEARGRKAIDAAARTFGADALQLGAIPGLRKLVPSAPLVGRLLAFAARGLTTAKPAPPAA